MNFVKRFTSAVAVCLSLALLVLLQACESQQQLSYDKAGHGRCPLDISFDWSRHPDADPESMIIYLFPVDGGEPLRYEFKGRDGDRVMVPVGTYTAIAFNSNTDKFLPCNTGDLHSFELRLRDAYELQGLSVRSADVPRAPGTEDERMTSTAGALWIAREDAVVVDRFTSRASLSLTPADVVCHYNVNVTGVKNLSGVMSLSASLSGMAGSIFPHDGSVSAENVTMSFELLPASETSLSGTLHSFGHCGNSRSRTRNRSEESDKELHQLTVYAVLTDGSQWYHTFDVTDQLHAINPDGSESINVHGLELPDAVSGGGFSVDVGGWSDVVELIPM